MLNNIWGERSFMIYMEIDYRKSEKAGGMIMVIE